MTDMSWSLRYRNLQPGGAQCGTAATVPRFLPSTAQMQILLSWTFRYHWAPELRKLLFYSVVTFEPGGRCADTDRRPFQ
jgi:hypothetical protein